MLSDCRSDVLTGRLSPCERITQAISSMLQQYGRPSGGYDIGGAAGLDFGGGGPSGADLRATSAGSAFGGGMSQGFQPVSV